MLLLALACAPKDGEPAPVESPDCVSVAEICNAVDDDCDGEVDEAGGTAWYPDADGDGFGDAAMRGEACEAPTGATPVGDDCDDDDAEVFPGAVETWYDGLDQDCDEASDFDQDGDGDDAADFGGGDCLDRAPNVSADRCGHVLLTQAGTLWEMTPNGETVASWIIVHPDSDYMYARGARVDALGRFVLFNGDSREGPDTYVSAFDETTGTWTHLAGPAAWNIGDTATYGEFALRDTVAWAPDPRDTRDAEGSGGLVRADLLLDSTTTLLPGDGYVTANLGLDGLIYALRARSMWEIDVIDPDAGTVLRTVTLDSHEDPSSLAADAEGRIWTADWGNSVIVHDADGGVLDSLDLGVGDLISIDLAADGRVVVGARSGELVFTDTSFADTTVVAAGDRADVTFAAWFGR